MGNWRKKIEAARKLRDIIDEKDDNMDVYLTLKRILEGKRKLSDPMGLMTDEEELINFLENSWKSDSVQINSSIVEELIGEVEVSTSEEDSGGLRMALEFTEELSKTAEKIGQRYVELTEEWVEAAEREGHSEENYEAVMEAIEMDGEEEFEVMNKIIKYKKNLPKMWAVYEILKNEIGEEVDPDGLYMLDEDLDEILNFLNDEIYDTWKSYM